MFIKSFHSSDLLGTIIPEQTKTLAPGKLFCVGDGKFKETEEFERYKKKKEGKMSDNLKKQLGVGLDVQLF